MTQGYIHRKTNKQFLYRWGLKRFTAIDNSILQRLLKSLNDCCILGICHCHLLFWSVLYPLRWFLFLEHPLQHLVFIFGAPFMMFFIFTAPFTVVFIFGAPFTVFFFLEHLLWWSSFFQHPLQWSSFLEHPLQLV